MKIQSYCWKVKLIPSLVACAAAAAIAAGAPPVLNTATGAAGNLGVGLGGGAPGRAAGFGGASLGSGASGALGAGGGPDIGGAPDVRASGQAFESMGMRRERLAAQAANAGGVAIDAPGIRVADEQAVSAVLSAGPSASVIRATRFETRGELAAGIERHLEADAGAMASLRARSRTLHRDAQAEFTGASKDVEVHERALRASVRIARKASAEDWAESCANLAANYEAYTRSVARAEAIANGGLADGHPDVRASAAANATVTGSDGR